LNFAFSKRAIAMQLEDYFDFLSPTDIRLKGHRVGIDTVLSYYLEGYTPEEIGSYLGILVGSPRHTDW
jgi:hypothetical protein